MSHRSWSCFYRGSSRVRAGWSGMKLQKHNAHLSRRIPARFSLSRSIRTDQPTGPAYYNYTIPQYYY